MLAKNLQPCRSFCLPGYRMSKQQATASESKQQWSLLRTQVGAQVMLVKNLELGGSQMLVRLPQLLLC